MAPHLPLEVLRLIVQHVANEQNEDGQPFQLASCALVNKAWQVVFEEAIYATIHIRSKSASDTVLIGDVRLPERGLPLEQLERILSQRPARRHAIRHIIFKAAVPQWFGEDFRQKSEEAPTLSDWRAETPGWLGESFREAHERDLAAFYKRANIWRESDACFTLALQDLFYTLSSPSWNSISRIRLSVMLQSEIGPAFRDRREEICPYTGDEQLQYRADFVPSTALPSLRCIESVDFPVAGIHSMERTENAISPSAQNTIAAASNARKVTLTERYHVGDSDLARIRKKLARNFRLLHASNATTLHLEWSDDLRYNKVSWGHSNLKCGPGTAKEMPLNVVMPADPLFYALHNTSMHLREIHIDQMRIAPDIFWPLIQENVPFWPQLQVFRKTRTPLAMSQKETLCYLYYGLDDYKHPVSITPTSDRSNPRAPYMPNRNKVSVVPSFFDELYTTIGRAAKRMPKIRNLLLSYGKSGRQELELNVSRENSATLRMFSLYGYSPTRSAMAAWGIELDQMGLQGEDLVAVFENWATH